jgi:hypothetical protein
MEIKAKASPRTLARIGGVLYLAIIVLGLFGEMVVRGKLVVPDAAATAHNIVSSQFLWRLGITGDLVMHVCDIPLMVIFYVLLKPVSKNLALLALLFNAIQSAALIAYKLNLLMALFLLGNASYLKALDQSQREALMSVFLKADSYGFGIGLIFFGFTCLVMGYLIYKSRYLPRMLGVLMQIAGTCYLINSFALLLAPSFANLLFPFILLPSFIGELAVCLWLLFKGVSLEEWQAVTSSD